MQSVTSVTQKGQVTIPKKIRDKVGLSINSKVYIEAVGNSIKVTPAYDILDLAGQFKPKNKKEILKARQELDNSYQRV